MNEIERICRQHRLGCCRELCEVTFSQPRSTLQSESSNTFSITADEELTDGGKINLDPIDDLVDTEIDTTSKE